MRFITRLVAVSLCGCSLLIDPAGPGADDPDAGCVSEVCNGLDDDCDGLLDEGTDQPCYEGPEGTEGVADCAAGVAACVAEAGSGQARYGACTGQRLPQAEACNGVDDDCDGQVDQGEGGPLTQACYPFDAGEPGVGECVAGAALCEEGELGLCEGAVGPGEESPDTPGDEDCDGKTDE